MYSLGLGSGQLVAFGSYNEASEDIVVDGVCIAALNSFTSLFAGVAIFSMSQPAKEVARPAEPWVFAPAAEPRNRAFQDKSFR